MSDKPLAGGVPVLKEYLCEDKEQSITSFDDSTKEAAGAQRGGGGKDSKSDPRDARDRKAGFIKGACIAFQKWGKCRLGDTCKYKHISCEPEVGDKRPAEEDVADDLPTETNQAETASLDALVPVSKRKQKQMRTKERSQREDRLCSATQEGRACTYENCTWRACQCLSCSCPTKSTCSSVILTSLLLTLSSRLHLQIQI